MKNKISLVVGSILALVIVSTTSVSAVASGSELISLGSNGILPDARSDASSKAITEDKRLVTFSSSATNLIPGFTPPSNLGEVRYQIYLHDRVTGTTSLVSKNNAGEPSNASAGNPIIGDTGRYVLFNSTASNFGSNSSGNMKCFIRDLQLGTTTSMTSSQSTCWDVSSDDNIIGVSGELNPVPYICPQFPCNWSSAGSTGYLLNRSAGTISPIAADSSGNYGKVSPGGVWQNYQAYRVSMSGDGNTLAFWSSSQLVPDAPTGGFNLFVRNITTNTVQLLKAPGEATFNQNSYAVVSGDGKYIAYTSLNASTDQYHTFVRNLTTGVDTQVDVTPNGSQANGYTNLPPSISDDGKYVSFNSTADNLVPGGSTPLLAHVFLRDMQTGITTQIDFNSDGQQSNQASGSAGLLQTLNDGTVLFNSFASNLAPLGVPAGQVYLSTPKLPKPTGLSIASPAYTPQLSWSSVNGADSYVIYRDGQNIGTTQVASYTDNGANDGNHSYYITAKSTANVESDPSDTVTVLVDKLSPGISYSFSPNLNLDGWSNTNVAVEFTCLDNVGGSGIANCTSPATVSIEGANNQVNGVATDNAGNSASTTTVVKLDKTAPTISYEANTAPNADGWYNSDVTVNFTCNDALSGVKSCSQPVTVSSAGAEQTVLGTSTDFADNSSSTTVSLNIDKTAPTITYTVTPATNANSWNKDDVTVIFSCSDNLSTIKSCPQPVTISSEGANQTVSGTATDFAGNSQTISVNVNLDRTAPTLSNLSWSTNPLVQGQNTTLSVAASDALSGVAGVYYSLDGGTPQAMTYDSVSNTWKATFGSTLAVNTYNVDVFATDSADNTSAHLLDVLAVYNPANGYVTGHAKALPTASDVLPIALDTSNNPAKLVLGFTNVTAPASGSFDLSYTVKNNQDAFSLSSTAISWIVVQDSTHASIQGKADLTIYVNGVKTIMQNVTVRFDITLGANGSPDHISVKIWNANQNPSTDLPTYHMDNDAILNVSQIFIH